MLLELSEFCLASDKLYHSNDLFFQIMSLDSEQFPFPWSQSSWENIIDKKSYKLFVIIYKQKVIGFSLFLVLNVEEPSHLLKIVIDKKFLQLGHASKLLSYSLNTLSSNGYKKCFLEVETSNLSAINLYNRYAFKKVGIAKGFYGHNKDGHRMLRDVVF